MAIVTFIKSKTQSKTAMKRVIDYVKQDKKTLYEKDGIKYNLFSGYNCCPELAFEEFMSTKKEYRKDYGMFFYHYVQSFPPDENISPELANEIGLDFADYFVGHEVLVATHIDVDHIHNHFIINSVSHTTGLKLQMGPTSLYYMRDYSDYLCEESGLSILPQSTCKNKKEKLMDTREYRSAVKGESWKLALMCVIDDAMENASGKLDFISRIFNAGYKIKWMPNRKYINVVNLRKMKEKNGISENAEISKM